MSGGLALFGRAFVIGIAVAAPVGAMGVLCVQRTLARGWRFGVATGAGIATADALYAAIAAFGLSSVASAVVGLQTPMRLAGGAFLIVIGVRAALRRSSAESAASDGSLSGGSAYLSAVGLTLTNPMTVISFGAIFASSGLATQGAVPMAAVATAGVALGSFAWWLALTTAVARTRHMIGPRALRAISVASGLVVAAFGAVAMAGAVS